MASAFRIISVTVCAQRLPTTAPAAAVCFAWLISHEGDSPLR
jgi:hypothetical protein